MTDLIAKPMKGWHFVNDTLRDGSPVPKDGVWLKHKGPLVMCESGFHWSKDPFDALRYAPGPVLCQIEARGETKHDSDKSVSRERRIVRRMDATEMLRYFARMQALSVIHLYPNGTDEVVFDYLMTGDESLRAAARAAAWAAAWAAAGDAARAAAWDAARAAAGDAARAAAWDAAGDAARAAQRECFNHLVAECFSYMAERSLRSRPSAEEARGQRAHNAAQRILNALGQYGHPDYSLKSMLTDIQENAQDILSALPGKETSK